MKALRLVPSANSASGFTLGPIDAAPAPARKFAPGQLHAIFLAARALAERANVACNIPRSPEIKDVWDGCDDDVLRAISDVMEAVNG